MPLFGANGGTEKAVSSNSEVDTAPQSVEVPVQTKNEEHHKGKIHNSIHNPSTATNSTPKTVEEVKEENPNAPLQGVQDDDDEWNSIPAFLRRAKK